MSDTIGDMSNQSRGAVQTGAFAALPHCVHLDQVAGGAGCACGLTWCDTPWSSSRTGCPWIGVRAA